MGPESKYFDLEAFKNDSPERNYWLGFLTADGCVLDNSHLSQNPQIQLTLADQMHVVAFKEFTKSEAKICEPRKGHASLTIRSKELAELLYEYHIVPRKSLKERAPDSLKMDSDYWRGVIDGDGCLGVNKRGFPRLELVGSKDLCEGFLSFVKTLAPTKVSLTKDKRTEGLYRVQLCGLWVKRVVEALYSGAEVALDRKAEIDKSILAVKGKRGAYV